MTGENRKLLRLQVPVPKITLLNETPMQPLVLSQRVAQAAKLETPNVMARSPAGRSVLYSIVYPSGRLGYAVLKRRSGDAAPSWTSAVSATETFMLLFVEEYETGRIGGNAGRCEASVVIVVDWYEANVV